jgi:GTP-binding protein HflX
LAEIGAGGVPVLTVLNKIDRVPPAERAWLPTAAPDSIAVSAATGEGVPELIELMASKVAMDTTSATFELDFSRADDRQLLADLHRHGRVRSQIAVDDHITVRADVPRRWLDRTGRSAGTEQPV